MNLALQSPAALSLLVVLAVSSFVLGLLPLVYNPWKRTHRAFAVHALNLALWFVASTLLYAARESEPALWLGVSRVAFLSLPVTFCQFVVFLPYQRFEGKRWALFALYAVAGLLAISGGGAWYLQLVLFLLAMAFAGANLSGKLRGSAGVFRRQIQHALAALGATAVLALLIVLLAPADGVADYLPCALILLTGWLATALVRYHLPDIQWVLARIFVYAGVAVCVVAIFLCMLSLGNWLFNEGGRAREVMPVALAALAVAFLLQPVKETLERRLDKVLFGRRFDGEALVARVSRAAVQCVRLDELLGEVAEDLRVSLGARLARIWLVSPGEAGVLRLAYSTRKDEESDCDAGQEFLLKFAGEHGEPLVLEQLVHRRVTPELARVAKHMAALDAYLLAPLRTRRGVAGLLVLGEKWTRDIYSDAEAKAVGIAANPLAQAIEGARLFDTVEEINERLERILRTMNGGVVAFDASGKVTTVNGRAMAILGAIAPGQGVDSLPGEAASWVRRALVEARDVEDVQLTLTGPDGENIPVALSVSGLADSERRHLGALLHIYDMSEIKRLESSVQRADRLTSIGTMAAGMAHEIKNPLQSIKTFTQLLLERFDDEDFRTTYAEVVPPEVKRIDAIVTRLLHFARPKPVRYLPQNLPASIEHVLALLNNQLHNESIEVRQHFPEHAPMVMADEQQLHQVFLNLVLNAIEAMAGRPERRLSIAVARGRGSFPRKGLGRVFDEPCAQVVISDTGRGIEEKHLKQIFTPFFTTSEQGSGLGLSVVHGIVADHEGQIDVSSVPGVGTAFTVTFPLAENADRLERTGA